MNGWLEVARRPQVYRRSRRVALLVGTILVGINYFDRILIGNVGGIDLVKMLLTYCVPFCVSTHASVSAIIEQEKGN
ncbi:MAG: hypothetical protein GKR93_08165 [Gammaproteobacteria bacterium]|nr:hypothetical protein [Gammaproteobacteria bacterium]